MDDRKLLELAAKAAGIGPVIGVDDGALVIGPNSRQRRWNPLGDDGDALRLAVKLHLALLFHMCGDRFKQCVAGQVGGEIPACMEPHDPDPYSATRRAIVRAASALGETMP